MSVQARPGPTGASIDVIDDGPGFNSAVAQPGHGLDLLRERLKLLCGPETRLAFASARGEMRVSIEHVPGARVPA